MKRLPPVFSILLLLISICVFTHAALAADEKLPTKENPLVIDKEGKRILIYTEVNEKNLHDTNPHWGVVFKDGKYGDKAILRSYAGHLAFHDALLEIGAKPGNNLTKDVLDVPVEGDILEMTATWPGLGKEVNPGDIFFDEAGKGFEIKFGGNRKASDENNTGCITCLESCWISIASNAKYPNISSAKRAITPNSRFKGKEESLPGGDKPVILIYHLVGSQARRLSPIISTEWLEKNLTAPGLVVLDTRKASEYESGHIPGAVNIPFDSLAVKTADLNDELPEEPVLAKLLGDAGIGADSRVVIVGKADNIAPEIGRNTRVAWTLAYAGIRDVALLDGAYNKWTDEKRPVSTDAVKPKAVDFKPEWNKTLLAPKGFVSSNKGVSTLVDVRPEGFFTGEKKHPLVERPGHISGATCILSEDIFMKDKTFRSADELKQVIEKAAGADKSKQIITYCNTGIMSSLGWFVLDKVGGYTNVKMYDGGLQEWSKDPASSIEK